MASSIQFLIQYAVSFFVKGSPLWRKLSSHALVHGEKCMILIPQFSDPSPWTNGFRGKWEDLTLHVTHFLFYVKRKQPLCA